MLQLTESKRLYDQQGYVLLKGFYNDSELATIEPTIRKFHDIWKSHNDEFYAKQAINSAYLTGADYLDNTQRQTLFQFLGTHKLMQLASTIIPNQVCFINTQLFFNPGNPDQKNYWHRDSQYNRSLEEQKQALQGPEMLHCRIALADEPGLELVPNSHKRWDTDEEYKIRFEQNGHCNHQDLSGGLVVPLKKGDLLVFSANIIHRGLYGMDRFALDVLFCDPEPELMQYARNDCLPSEELMEKLENGKAFRHTLALKNQIITN